ncbi:MAG: ABC transporter ATP-binding protein [Clostridiaceae bacterium]
MNVLEVNNLTKKYGSKIGVKDVSFKVAEGEIFGFIGPNGAGKSTTIRSILNLIRPTSGSIQVFGLDSVKDAPLIAKNVGYLPSEVFYYDGMRAKDLLNFSASFYKKVDKSRINKLADLLELDLSRKVDDLSYGNKKKLGIIQGLLHSPSLIILDEPTGGLDPLMQQKFFDLIKDENKNGATVLFSSHILTEVQRLCDKVAIIKNGEIIKVDEIETMKKDNYKKISIESETKLNDLISALPGAANVNSIDNKTDFLFKGDINSIISMLSSSKIRNLTIEDPNLEEIFMHYYE